VYPFRVLSSELDLSGLDARQWNNWWQLLVPPRVLAQPNWALAILDGGKVAKLVITGKGSVDPQANPLPGLTERDLAAWAGHLNVAAIVAIEREVIEEIAREIESSLRIDQDLVEQGFVALRALKRHAGKGVYTEPPLLDVLPAPAYEPMQRTFDLLIPDRTALVAYVLEDKGKRIYSSIIAVKNDGDIVRASTHRAIADLVPETAFARDWQKQYKRVLTAVEDRFAKPSVAVFLERATLMKILTGPSDQLPREYNAKAVIIDPAPTWLIGLLGGATVAAMAGRAATALAGMLPQRTRDAANQIANRARDAMKESGAHPFSMLGFDPLELWQRLKQFYRP
jgi:hypothetical protein